MPIQISYINMPLLLLEAFNSLPLIPPLVHQSLRLFNSLHSFVSLCYSSQLTVTRASIALLIHLSTCLAISAHSETSPLLGVCSTSIGSSRPLQACEYRRYALER